MLRFLFHGAVFFLVLCIINIPVYRVIADVYWGEYKDVDLNFKNIILSDSHGLPLDDFTEEHGYYNLSAGSDSYSDMLIKLNYMIRNADIDTLIISVDDHTLSTYREGLNNKDRSAHYATSKDFDNFYKFIKEKYIKNYFVLLNGKQRDIVYNYIKSQIVKIVKPNILEPKKWNEMTEQEMIFQAEGRAKMQFKNHQQSASLIESLEMIIETCLENDIHIIGIKYPLTQLYINVLDDQSFNADSIFFFHNLPVYDFTDLYVEKDEFFINQDHLNEEGGKEFTEFLFETIRE